MFQIPRVCLLIIIAGTITAPASTVSMPQQFIIIYRIPIWVGPKSPERVVWLEERGLHNKIQLCPPVHRLDYIYWGVENTDPNLSNHSTLVCMFHCFPTCTSVSWFVSQRSRENRPPSFSFDLVIASKLFNTYHMHRSLWYLQGHQCLYPPNEQFAVDWVGTSDYCFLFTTSYQNMWSY